MTLKKDYEEFIMHVKNFQAAVRNVPKDDTAKYGVHDSEFSSALQEHVENTMENMKVDQSKYWGLAQKQGVEKYNELFTSRFFNIGYMILEAYRGKKQNTMIIDYLQKTRNLRSI
jgi:hypothetical protein